jgi:predicted permease
MFDMGHAIMAWTLTTVVACRYAGHPDDIPVLLVRTLASPPLWVLAFALTLNVSGVRIPDDVLTGVLRVGQACVLLVPLAMGLLVTARGLRRREVWIAVGMRSALGVLLGLGLGWALPMEDDTARVLLLGAAAPIGFSAVVLTSRESLDVELTATAAAISVFAGALWIPLAVTLV